MYIELNRRALSYLVAAAVAVALATPFIVRIWAMLPANQ